jgi:dTDP-4-amino-4,6-dideoxygalactose transaminase
MDIPLVDLKAQYQTIKTEIDTAIHDVLDNTAFILGKHVKDFEKNFAEFCQTKHAIGVSNGTTALKLALAACGIGAGDEVITTPHTFAATIEAIITCGAKPVFGEIFEKTYNLAYENIEPLITEKTKAILPVHLYGKMCDMEHIMEIAKKHNLKVIEDCAQAHGAEWNGKRAGSYGDAAAFSFYPGKNLGAYGDAGAVVTNNDKIAEKVMLMRNHGRKSKYEHSHFGTNERIDALQCAILNVKMKHIEYWTEKRRENAKIYDELLAGKDVIIPYNGEPISKHVYHLYVIRTKNRNEILAKLNEKGIGAGIHYPIPLHLQPAYSDLGYKEGNFPITERVSKEIISLPMYPELTKEQIEQIVNHM